MTTFQLDQCLNDKRFATDCNAQGLASAWCFPKKLVGASDPDVLNSLLQKQHPFLTLDQQIAEAHAQHIPDRNPGIIVISNVRGGNPQTMTTTLVRKVLAKFKQLFPGWYCAVGEFGDRDHSCRR